MKTPFLLAALLCVGYEHVFFWECLIGSCQYPASRTTSNSDFRVFRAPLAAKYACESGYKRLRSSLLQTFLWNTCFVLLQTLQQKMRRFKIISLSVSTIVGCWNAYRRQYGRLCLVQVCQLIEHSLILHIITEVTWFVSVCWLSIWTCCFSVMKLCLCIALPFVTLWY